MRIALNGEEYRHCSAGLQSPRLSIRGTMESGFEVWFHDSKGLSLTQSGFSFEASIAVHKVGATEKKTSPVEIPMAMERNDHGPVLRSLEVPDVLLPEAALSRRRCNPQKLKENAEHLFKGGARVKGKEQQPPPPPLPDQAEMVPTLAYRGHRNDEVQDFVPGTGPQPMDAHELWQRLENGDEDYGLDAPPQPQPATDPPVTAHVPVVVDAEHFDIPPETPTISDLKAAIGMVNELAAALGEEIVLVVENNQIHAKRKIVHFVELD